MASVLVPDVPMSMPRKTLMDGVGPVYQSAKVSLPDGRSKNNLVLESLALCGRG